MNDFSKLLTDESVISFTDGTVIEGSEKVGAVIMRCCREYNNGYMHGLTKMITKGIVVGVILTGVGIGISKIIKTRNSKIKGEKKA